MRAMLTAQSFWWCGVAPPPFDWVLVLDKAGSLLPVPFEKQAHAKVKYGDENYFSTMYGGRSLRATAEQVITVYTSTVKTP